MVNRVSIYSVSAEKVWISESQAVQRTTDKNRSEDSESFRLQSFGFKIEPRDVTDVMWSGVDRSRDQRQDKYLYHFGIFFVIFRNILSEYHIQIKTIKICKLRQGQTMIIIEPLIWTNFLQKMIFSQNFHQKWFRFFEKKSKT